MSWRPWWNIAWSRLIPRSMTQSISWMVAGVRTVLFSVLSPQSWQCMGGAEAREHRARRHVDGRLPGPRAPDPNALGLENQKAPSQVLLFKSGDPSEEEPDLLTGRRSARESRDKNPVMGSEGKAEDVCEALIARDQGVTMRACRRITSSVAAPRPRSRTSSAVYPCRRRATNAERGRSASMRNRITGWPP